MVPRVPADLHAARGGHHPLHQARPRLRRPRRARGRARHGSGATAGDDGRRTRSRRPRRRHRRRTDLARRQRSSAGSRRAATRTTAGARSRSATSRPRWRPPMPDEFEIEIIGRRRPARLQLEPVFDPPGEDACTSEHATRDAGDRDVGAVVVDGTAGRRTRRATRVAIAVLRAGEHPHHGGTLCLAGDCPNCVRRGRRHRVRADVPDAGARRASSCDAIRRSARRRCRRWPSPTSTAAAADGATSTCGASTPISSSSARGDSGTAAAADGRSTRAAP